MMREKSTKIQFKPIGGKLKPAMGKIYSPGMPSKEMVKPVLPKMEKPIDVSKVSDKKYKKIKSDMMKRM